MTGAVEVRPTREGQWTSASENMEIAEGGGIRTGAEGGAVLLMPNKSRIWLKEGTALEIEQRQTLASRLALVFGRIKVRVPHLMRKEKFEVRTPAAVCAVRGTEFTMGATENGKTDVQVLFGEVKFKFTVPQAKGKSEFNIPQGQSLASPEEGKAARPVLLTPKQERAALESWNPGLTAEQRQEGLIQKETDRAQIKDFARATANAENAVKGFLNVAKESDLEAGRTLRDVHGNLVRVDQRLMRPNADEIQFFNLVKRPVYNYTKNSGATGFMYNGAQGIVDRLDYMQMTMNFNKDLPQRIEEWPAFFDSNSIDPDWASFVVANRTNAGEIFFVADNYKFDPSRDNGNGELVSNPWTVGIPTSEVSADDRKVIVTGVLTGATAVEGLNKISRLQIADAGAGALNYTDASGTPTTPVNAAGNVVWAIKTAAAVAYEAKDTGDNVNLWQYQADMYDVGNAGTSFMWLAKENYVIGNGGGVKNVNDYTNSSTDPFSLLKESAVQSIMYVKQSNSTTPGAITSSALAKAAVSDTDYFSYAGAGTNIDVVFIPDLMVAAVQRMLPAITNLGK